MTPQTHWQPTALPYWLQSGYTPEKYKAQRFDLRASTGKIEDYLRGRVDGASAREMCEDLALSEGTVRNTINHLIMRNFIRPAHVKREHCRTIYKLNLGVPR